MPNCSFGLPRRGIEGLFRELAAHPEQITEIGRKYGTTYFLDE